ncbi:MAG TPA: GNAT family N-acetyltransferase [Stellaceae bacterium]|nr:GNAT family N-acetyltransferase [Stellaceae bacterium]
MTATEACTIRDATADDLPAITAIYQHHVLTGTGSFEEVPPPIDELRRRFDSIRQLGLPYLVAEIAGTVAGYAYASQFRPRSAYRFTVEDSIYVDRHHMGRGVGRVLLDRIIADCTAKGYRQMIAVVGDSANTGSIRLHAAAGFRMIGCHEGVGLKFGRWLDIVMMQRALSEEAAAM